MHSNTEFAFKWLEKYEGKNEKWVFLSSAIISNSD